MDFFNKLSKKASETYKVTKEKANIITEEIKIKNKISDKELQINKLYTEIGKIVYENVKDDKDVSRDIIVERTEEISRLKDDISKLKVELLAVRKIKKCINCGAELEITTEYCPKCGTKQPKIEKVEVEVKNEEVEANEAENAKVNEIKNEENK